MRETSRAEDSHLVYPMTGAKVAGKRLFAILPNLTCQFRAATRKLSRKRVAVGAVQRQLVTTPVAAEGLLDVAALKDLLGKN